MARLNTFVHVSDVGEDGEYRSEVFGPADDVPGWAVQAITNPKVWAEAPPEREAEREPAPAGTGASDLVEPPRSGKGSGVEAWREYAELLGWFEEVPAEATKDDLVKAIDAERAERAKKTGE